MEIVKPVSRSSFKAQDRAFQHSREFRQTLSEDDREHIAKLRAEARKHNMTSGQGQYIKVVHYGGKEYWV